MTSAAYRQSSRVTPELVEKDPENRLLARGPRFRLPAEMIRDSALDAAGLLNPEMGGRGVFPYQPKGTWEDIAYGDVYSAQSYVQSHGQELYRRSMYTFWKRTAPPPSLITFDAPDREKCTARRAVTNTPLQALVLLNDPTYIEAARALAERTLREGGRSTPQRIAFAFREATSRKPSAKEEQVLAALLKQPRGSGFRPQAARGRRIEARRAARPGGSGCLDQSGERDPQPGRNDYQGVAMSVENELRLAVTRRHFFSRTATGIGGGGARFAAFGRRPRPQDRRAGRPAALPAESETRHLSAPIRRPRADGPVRLQTGAQKIRRALTCRPRYGWASGSRG